MVTLSGQRRGLAAWQSVQVALRVWMSAWRISGPMSLLDRRNSSSSQPASHHHTHPTRGPPSSSSSRSHHVLVGLALSILPHRTAPTPHHHPFVISSLCVLDPPPVLTTSTPSPSSPSHLSSLFCADRLSPMVFPNCCALYRIQRVERLSLRFVAGNAMCNPQHQLLSTYMDRT